MPAIQPSPFRLTPAFTLTPAPLLLPPLQVLPEKSKVDTVLEAITLGLVAAVAIHGMVASPAPKRVAATRKPSSPKSQQSSASRSAASLAAAAARAKEMCEAKYNAEVAAIAVMCDALSPLSKPLCEEGKAGNLQSARTFYLSCLARNASVRP